jgi:hypothetical protein
MLRENFVDAVVDQVSDGLLTINFLDGSGQSGPDVVQVLDGTTTWVFEKGDLKDILEGDDSLPADLLTVVNTAGMQEQAFTAQLLVLFGRAGKGN